MQTAHIYNPASSTLEDKVASLKKVLEAYRDVKASLDNAQNSKQSEQLGSVHEIQEAKVVIQNSLKKAVSDLNKEELQKAHRSGLLSEHEAKEVVVFKRLHKIKDSRSTQDSKSHSHQK